MCESCHAPVQKLALAGYTEGKKFVAEQFFGLADTFDEEQIIPRAVVGKPESLDPVTLDWCASEVRRLAEIWSEDD